MASAGQRPGKLCVKLGSHPGYTYAEVQDAMDRCAKHLVKLSSPVLALVADRSYGLVVSLLATLRAGKAYCPIEPDFPVSRAGIMLATASIKDVLVPVDQFPQSLLSHFDSLNVLAVHDNGRVDEANTGEELPAGVVLDEVSDNATAYILFTSGSTGKPKGCMVPHRGSARYAKAVVQVCQLDSTNVFVLKTPYVFDVSVQDIFVAFCAGGTLIIADPGAHKDTAAMADLICQNHVNCCCFVPTLLVEFSNYLSTRPDDVIEVSKHLRHVLTIGEALMTDTCQQMLKYFPELKIHNLYGPTEASVGVSHYCSTNSNLDLTAAVVPIGKPFDYVSFRVFEPAQYEGKTDIVSADLIATEEGQVGELFIGGDCLAQGYIANPEKTASVFFHFPDVEPRPSAAASQFSLYKTGDLVKRRPDGNFDYLGRNDFQVKISGVRIECEEVSAVLKTHPFVQDALVTAFDGPFGKALAAYIVASDVTDWTELPKSVEVCQDVLSDGNAENVTKWGAVYDEMYKHTGASTSENDMTLNWSGYIDTYSRRPHIEPVIKEWVEWSCQQVSRHYEEVVDRGCITELGCGNGMLLFRLAPLIGSQGKYVGTDISTTALEHIRNMSKRSEYNHLGIETVQLAAHEILKVCKERENDIVLCNGVTMYFPSTTYLLDCMQSAARATRSDGFVIFGDIQSKKHLLPFRCHVETYHALRRADATAAAVLRAAKKAAAHEELSYFDDTLFHHLDCSGTNLFQGRLARVELRLKRGWWQSEFTRFRYDVELVLCEEKPGARKSPNLLFLSYAELSDELQLDVQGDFVHPGLAKRLQGWIYGRLRGLPASTDGVVIKMPNARTLQCVRLLRWLEENAPKGKSLAELPHELHPVDAFLGSGEASNMFGIEPEMLFNLQLPEGWTQRVIWDDDPALLRLVLLREAAAQQPWLGAVSSVSDEALPADLTVFKNRPEDVLTSAGLFDPAKACNDALKAWASKTSLLPAMQPAVFITVNSFPKNAAGKTDRSALPDAQQVFLQVSDATEIDYEAPATQEEKRMAQIWESVLKVSVGVSTPFIAYGGHSLTALQLNSKILTGFGKRPELAFLTSEDCTVRALLQQLSATDSNNASEGNCIVRLSPRNRRGCNLLIFCAAGTSAAAYKQVAEHAGSVQIYAVELPGRGQRAAEATETRFRVLMDKLEPTVTAWAEQQKNHLFLWGDSLGAVMAYTFACKWQESRQISLLGLIVSGNAGPTEASEECGIGASAAMQLGFQHTGAADMTQEDWMRFLIASSGKKGEEMKELMKDQSLAETVLAPLRADCLVYESYYLERAIPLNMPIMTMRGALDCITSPQSMNSWKEVAGGRLEHKELQHAGHMLAIECPALVAQHLDQVSLPDFSEELEPFSTFRAAYRLLRDRRGAQNPRRFVSSPDVAVRELKIDVDTTTSFSELEKVLTENLTPQTRQVKQMRLGNMEWRKGGHKGSDFTWP